MHSTSHVRLPAVPARKFFECAPDFALEVVSPTDRWETVIKKAGIWIAHGVEVVWVLDPLEHRVAIVRPEGQVELLRGGGVASAEPAVPGFSIALADLFRDLPTAD